MSRALIGSTGFVGGNLLRQASFDACYHSRNIAEIADRQFEWLVCAGAPAEKWRANRDPASDRANLARLEADLSTARARRAILISTVDVYPRPFEVDEATPFNPPEATPYGYHRFQLETFFRERFDTLIVRLPGLFGQGLKKNVVFDLLHGHALEQVHADSSYQYYPLRRLWADLMAAWDAGLRLINLATEPIATETLAREVFNRPLTHRPSIAPARYDMRSRHAALLGGQGGYLLSREAVLTELRAFVAEAKGGHA